MPVQSSRATWLALCVGLLAAGCDAPPYDPRFAILLVDENIDVEGTAPALWLKREGGMDGPLVAEAQVGTSPDGRPVVELTLTPEGRNRLAALTRANIGRRLAVVVNGDVVAASIIGAEMADGRVMIDGNYTDGEARAMAAELMATRQPGGP